MRDKTTPRFLAILQIIGGLVGVWAAISSSLVVRAAPGSGVHAAVTFASLLLASVFLVAVVAGVLLWRETRSGMMLSCLVHVLQVPILLSAPIRYECQVGLAVPVRVIFGHDGFRDLMLGPFLGSGAQFGVGGEGAGEWAVGVNLLAVLALIVLVVWMRKKARPVDPVSPPPLSDSPSGSGDSESGNQPSVGGSTQG